MYNDYQHNVQFDKIIHNCPAKVNQTLRVDDADRLDCRVFYHTFNQCVLMVLTDSLGTCHRSRRQSRAGTDRPRTIRESRYRQAGDLEVVPHL